MRPKAGRRAAAVAPIPEEARAPAASELERLGTSFVAAGRLTHPPSAGSRACLTIPAMGDAGRWCAHLRCERPRMAWEAAAHALGSRRRRIPQPPPFHFRHRLKTQDSHSRPRLIDVGQNVSPVIHFRAVSRPGEFFRYMVWGLLLAGAFFIVAIAVFTLLERL
jgi:hypothetical protein